MDLFNKAFPTTLYESPPTSSSFLLLEVDLLQSRLEESERTLREVQKHNHFLRNIVETLQSTRDGPQRTPVCTSTPKKLDLSSPYSHTLHTQSSLTKLKHRSLDECHAKYMLAVEDLKYICQDHMTKYEKKHGQKHASPSTVATNRLVAEVVQLIDDSAMKIDRLIIRLRRNQDHPSYDEDDHQPSPQQQQQQQQHPQPPQTQRGVISDTPITQEYLREEQVHHHGRDSRYIAMQNECADLRRQLTMLHEQINAWKSSRNEQQESTQKELDFHYQRAAHIADFQAQEKITLALLDRDAAVDRLEKVQGLRRAQEEYHTNYVQSLQLAEQQAQEAVHHLQRHVIDVETLLTSAREDFRHVEIDRNELLQTLRIMEQEHRDQQQQQQHHMENTTRQIHQLQTEINHLQEQKQKTEVIHNQCVHDLQAEIKRAMIASEDAISEQLRMDSENSHLKLELIQLRKIVALFSS